MDVVELRASDTSLIHGVKFAFRAKTEKKVKFKKGLAGRTKERTVLKDVSNVLGLKSVTFKPSRTGLKTGSGGGAKEVGPINVGLDMGVSLIFQKTIRLGWIVRWQTKTRTTLVPQTQIKSRRTPMP